MWYCRHEIQLRQALFFSAASIAGAFSGLLAFAIAKMDGVGGLEGWRWIFILEGIVTVVVAISAYFLLFDFPETAGFLTQEEKDFVVHRLKYQGQVDPSSAAAGGGQGQGPQVAEADEFRWAYVWQAFSDWQIWVNIFVYWGVSHLPDSHPPPPFFFSENGRTLTIYRSSVPCMASACSSPPSSRTWATSQAPRSSSPCPSTSPPPSSPSSSPGLPTAPAAEAPLSSCPSSSWSSASPCECPHLWSFSTCECMVLT